MTMSNGTTEDRTSSATWQSDNTNVATSGLYGDFVTLSVVIPEPASMGLLGVAGLGLLARRRRA